MKPVDQQEGERITKPHLEFFVSMMKESIADWKKVSSLFPTSGPTTRANFISDRMRDKIRQQYLGDKATRIYDKGRLFFLRIENLALRFKKLKNSRPSNISTRQAIKLEAQQLELGEQLQPLTLANVGYSPDKAWNKFKYEISCIKNKRIVWRIRIDSDVATGRVSVIEIPESDILQPTTTKRVFKKVRKQ